MITEKQYEAAQQLVKSYKKQQIAFRIQNLKCICCNQAIVPVSFMPPLDENLTGAAWEKGTVTNVSFGYGSNHDGEAYYIALCDACVQAAVDKGSVIPYSALQFSTTAAEEE